MKAYTVIGYTADASVYCPDCLPYDENDQDGEGNDVHPIFAGDEHASQERCEACGEPLID